MARILQFLIREIRPFVINARGLRFSRSALAGHSLSALFVLHAMAREPQSFDGYAAFSPRYGGARRRPCKRSRAPILGKPLMLTVGALEQPAGDLRRAERAMVDRARLLADTLAPRLRACSFEIILAKIHGTARRVMGPIFALGFRCLKLAERSEPRMKQTSNWENGAARVTEHPTYALRMRRSTG